MRLLKNFDSMEDYYDLDSHNFYVFGDLQKNIGMYKISEGNMSAIIIEEDLIFLWQNQMFIISDDYHMKIRKEKIIDKHSVLKKFSLYKLDLLLVEFNYIAEVGYNIPPFDYIDDEDSDWGLFLLNIINNLERKKQFIKLRNQKKDSL